MRVARLLIYDGPESLVLAQLGRSMPDGTRTGLHGGGGPGVKLSVITLGAAFLQSLVDAGQQLRGLEEISIYATHAERGQLDADPGTPPPAGGPDSPQGVR